MPDVLFADISEFQSVVNDSYPYAFLSFRSNDGSYRDRHFYSNLSWAKSRVAIRKLKGFIVYYVYEPGVDSVSVLKNMVGAPHRKMAVMIDVESWGGRIHGDHSAAIRAERERVIAWLNGARGNALTRRLYRSRDRKRVLIYGNAYDLASIAPNRGDAQIVVANYSQKPSSPKHLIHQFSSSFRVNPFGACDINSADGLTSDQFVKALGLDTITIKPAPKPTIPPFPIAKDRFYGQHAPNYNGNSSPIHRAEIKKIQLQLVKHGFAGKVNPNTWCDGHFGSETAAAVRAFKKSKHWRQTGIIGRRAWNALFALG